MATRVEVGVNFPQPTDPRAVQSADNATLLYT